MPIHNAMSTIMAMPMPTVPINMPTRIVKPSRLSSPNDMINMPQPGKKLVRGIGNAIDTANTNAKTPMNC